MTSKNTLGVISDAAFNAGLVLLGALAGSVKDTAIVAGITAIVFLLAVVIGLRHQSREAMGEIQAEWDRSYREFRNNLTTVALHLNTALHTAPPEHLLGKGWSDLAMKSRWPEIVGSPLKGWPRRMASWMTPEEKATLYAAQYVEQVEGNTIPFQLARSHLTDTLSKWVERKEGGSTLAIAAKRIAEHREAIVMLAYLEIAHAERIPKVGPLPEAWSRSPECWAVLANPVVVLEGTI